MVKVSRIFGATAVPAPGAPVGAPPADLVAPAARRPAMPRTGGPEAVLAHPLHAPSTCLTCADVARRIGRRGRSATTRASGHRLSATFPPGGGAPTRCQATLLAPRAPPMTV